jgi:indolepyruvate ferredoxin oxidoreductase, beta subunit
VSAPRRISIAVLAMGGEGGGVLADWIVDLASQGGYLAQTTSVPGVAQRTGATIYYIELFPKAAVEARGREPVLALMPVPGDVDVVLASELMEAGRAVQRGFVTPNRTTLIASTHRVYAMTERIALADGRVDAAALVEACAKAAKTLVAFDMAGLAEATGSVISAVLFGALAGSGALPFSRGAFEAAIRRGGVGVAASLEAFKAGFEAASAGDRAPEGAGSGALPPPTLDGRDSEGSAAEASPIRAPSEPALKPLLAEADRPDVPEPARAIIREGLRRCADYQDVPYARRYLDRLQPILALAGRDPSGRLAAETARALALGMTYEDTIRVAELKLRPERFARVREEVKLQEGQLLDIAEFMHPRLQEIAETLPAPLGRWLLGTGWARGLVGRFTRKGRVVRTSSIRGFLLLSLVAAMKPLRPRSLRFAEEQEALDRWLSAILETARRDPALAAEIAEARTLVKGYGDTHERGRARFETLMAVLPQVAGQPDAAAAFARLRKAANADDSGRTLAEALGGIGPTTATSPPVAHRAA